MVTYVLDPTVRAEAIAGLRANERSWTVKSRRAGEHWYRREHVWCRDTGDWLGYPVDVVAGVASAFSPRCAWSYAKQKTVAFLATGGDHRFAPGMASHVAAAKRVLASWGACPDVPAGPELHDRAPAWLVLRGPKTLAFAACLAQPEETSAVVLDTWMFQTMRIDPAWVTERRYEALAEIVRERAEAWEMRPCQYQAVVWVTARGSAE